MSAVSRKISRPITWPLTGKLGALSPYSSVVAPVIPAWVLANASLDIDFANNRAWSAAFGAVTPADMLTVVRASTGLALDSAGAWSSFATDTLRRTDLGLFIERGRTNVFLQSTDLTNAANVVTSATVTGGQAAPDGTTNAATFLDLAASSQHRILNASTTFTNGAVYIFMVRAKAGSGSFLQLTFNATQFSGVGYANFDLSLGTRTALGGTLINANIISEGNGWYCCYISATATATGAGGAIIARVSTGAGARAEVYTGGATTVLLWNPGIHSTLTYTDSPIYTGAASATRSSDNITPIASVKALMDAAKSAYAETRRLQGGTAPRIADFGGVASIQASTGTTGTTVAAVGSGSTATATIGGAGTVFGLTKSAFSFDGVNNAAIANGGTQVTAAGAWGVTTETPQIGNIAALTAALEGYLGRLAFSSSANAFDALTV